MKRRRRSRQDVSPRHHGEGRQEYFGETWIDVPSGPSLAIRGFHPIRVPVPDGILCLPARPARIELRTLWASGGEPGVRSLEGAALDARPCRDAPASGLYSCG